MTRANAGDGELERTIADALNGTQRQIVDRYVPANEEDPFHRDYFVVSQDQLLKIKEAAEKLGKNPHDLGAREKIAEIAYGDKSLHVSLSPETMLKLAKDLQDAGSEGFGRYVTKHFDNIFGKVEGEGLAALVQSKSFKLYTRKNADGSDSEGYKGHNALVNLFNEVRSMEEIASEDSELAIEKMRKVVLDKSKGKYVSEWHKKFIKYAAADSQLVKVIFARTLAARKNALGATILNSDGRSVNKELLRGLVLNSLNIVKERYESASEGDKDDVWKKEVRPAYLAIAETAYPYFKNDLDAETDSNPNYRITNVPQIRGN